MKIYDGCLPSSFKMIVSGGSNTGKSTLINNIVLNRNGLLTKSFDRIIYLQGMETEASRRLQKLYGENMITFNGIPQQEILLPLCKVPEARTLLVVEDLEASAAESSLIAQIFRAYSHHWGFSVILSNQNFFNSGKERLGLIRNATHLVLFPNYLDKSVVSLIARKVHPENPKKLTELFEQVTSQPYGYLSIWGNCDKDLKFRTNITHQEQKVFSLE
jgi:hypothetical protein